MRTKLRSKVTLLFMTCALLIAVPAVAAIADQLRDELTAATPSATITQNDPNGFVNTYHLDDTGQGPNVNGQCDVNAANPATFQINTPPGVTATPNTLTFTQCGTATTNTQDVTFTASVANTSGYNITATQISGANFPTDTIQTPNATFTLIVNPDTTKPTVTSFTPTPDGVTGVAKGTDVTATFSEAMDAATLNDAEGDGNFTLKKTSDNSLVGASVSYNATDKKATLNPNADLAYNTQYTATVSTGAKDLAGNALDQDGAAGTQDSKTWTFTTELPPCTNPADPVFAHNPDGNSGWYKTPPTVSATSSTSGAVVKYSDAADGTYDTTAPTLGEGETTVYAKAFDSTGNCSSAVVSQLYKVDSVDPSIVDGGSWTQALPGNARTPDGDDNWYVTEVFNKFTASDATSGLANSTTDAVFTKGSGTQEGDKVKINSGLISDVAGNSSSLDSAEFKIDLKNPSILGKLVDAAGDLLAPASTGWYNIATGAPKAHYDCDDVDGDGNAANGGASGVATCGPDHLFGSDANPQSDTGTVTDNAGHSDTATVNNVKVDLSKPTNIAFQGGPAAGGSYDFGSVPAAPTGCTADDTFSGFKNCAVSGYSTAVGNNHTLTATANDNAGNSDTATRSYSVLAATAKGFYQPVDMGDVLNTVKSGSTVPVKFELFGGATNTEQKTVSAVGSMTANKVSCAAFTGDPVDAIEYLAPTSENTGLRFDTTGDQFIYNWKTPAKAANTCYSLTMTAADNTTKLVAYFQLK